MLYYADRAKDQKDKKKKVTAHDFQSIGYNMIHPLSKTRQRTIFTKNAAKNSAKHRICWKKLCSRPLDCTRFLSVVYCFCYGKVPVRCAGHSKEEKGNER